MGGQGGKRSDGFVRLLFNVKTVKVKPRDVVMSDFFH